MARTFAKHIGVNFDSSDYNETSAGFHWQPMMGGKAFDRAETARESAEDRRRSKACRLHIGVDTVEVEGTSVERRTQTVGVALTPRDLTDDELAVLAAQLREQVRETNATAQEVADQAVADFESRKSASVAALEQLLTSLKAADEQLNLGLRAARVELARTLADQKNSSLRRGDVLREHRVSDTLMLTLNEVVTELQKRRAVKDARRAELQVVLAEAGINL